jgi:hypothetical protein
MSIVDQIIKYESGEMERTETIAFFKEIYKSGLVFKLQGHYQRMLEYFINSGDIERDEL